MWYYPISDLVKIINIKNAIISILGWDDSEAMLDIVSHCNDFIEAYKVDEETNRLAFGEFGRRMKDAYEWLKNEGAGLD